MKMYILIQLGKAFGIESQVLSPAETKKLYPLMNVKDVYGTLYSPEDGTIDPAGYCDALTRAAKHKGAQVLQTKHLFTYLKFGYMCVDDMVLSMKAIL